MRYFIIESNTTVSDDTFEMYKYRDYFCVKDSEARPKYLKELVREYISDWCMDLFDSYKEQFKRAEWEDQEDYTDEVAFERFVEDTMDNTDYFEVSSEDINRFREEEGLGRL